MSGYETDELEEITEEWTQTISTKKKKKRISTSDSEMPNPLKKVCISWNKLKRAYTMDSSIGFLLNTAFSSKTNLGNIQLHSNNHKSKFIVETTATTKYYRVHLILDRLEKKLCESTNLKTDFLKTKIKMLFILLALFRKKENRLSLFHEEMYKGNCLFLFSMTDTRDYFR